MLELYPFQQEARDKILDAYRTRSVQRGILNLPTGAGKTLTAGHVIKGSDPHPKVSMLVHRDELVWQAHNTYTEMFPHLKVGIVKADEGNDVNADISIMSVQTVSQPKRLVQLPQDRNLVIADEAHHATAETWMRVLSHLGVFKPDGPFLLGLTATPERGDKTGLDSVFQKILARKTLKELIPTYLADVRGIQIMLDADFSKLKSAGDDYNAGEAGRILMSANAPLHVVRAYVTHAWGRKALCFTPTIDVADAITEKFMAAGIPAATISERTPKDERRKTLQALRAGTIKVISNCTVLTEGFDEPSIDCILVVRPTKSKPLWMQMIGRGTRKFPGKDHCKVLDFMGASNRHDLVTGTSLLGLDPTGRESIGEAKIREEIEEQYQTALQADRERLIAQQIDLFHEREHAWGIVNEATFALPLRDWGQLIVFEEKPGTWAVLEIGSPSQGWPKHIRHRTESLEAATTAAEEHQAKKKSAYLSDGKASWRGDAPTPGQLGALARRGIPAPRTKGEAADLLNVAAAKQNLKHWRAGR